MLQPHQLHEYQKNVVNFQCSLPNTMVFADMGLGKQQPNSEPVLTPTGWRPMGDLRVGDRVIGKNGKPTNIIGVFPQGMSEVMRITFSDGSSCRAGREHLWSVIAPDGEYLNGTTDDVVDHMYHSDEALYIPSADEVQFDEGCDPMDRKPETGRRYFKSIEYVGVEESTCIMVDAPDQLYVTKDYIVTHNTSITLTSVNHLIQTNYLKAVLVVAPIRVCRLVWRQEALKWSHLNHMKFSMVLGDPQRRLSMLLRKDVQVFLTNYENLQWLAVTLKTLFINKGRALPFDGVVFDEISKCKNSSTNRVKAFRKIEDSFKWTTGLTGTPASNGIQDLHGQYLVVDKGVRLGTSKTAFKTKFYKKIGPFKEVLYEDSEQTIKNLVGDITYELSAADYNPLPDLIVNDVEVDMPDDLRTRYEAMEKELFIKLDSGAEVEMFNQASLMMRCLQFGNGAMYPVPGMPLYETLHDIKLDALEDIVEEASGSPIFCAYMFRSDAERIMKRFAKLRPINLTACKTETSLNNAMARWKAGDCPLMIAQPASASHGIDGLQTMGKTLVWYGITWSLDLYDQFNARLRRQGQGAPVICHRIVMRDTIDQAQMLSLNDKANTQAGLRKAIKEYRLTKTVQPVI